jgi:hypothetical protein
MFRDFFLSGKGTRRSTRTLGHHEPEVNGTEQPLYETPSCRLSSHKPGEDNPSVLILGVSEEGYECRVVTL